MKEYKNKYFPFLKEKNLNLENLKEYISNKYKVQFINNRNYLHIACMFSKNLKLIKYLLNNENQTIIKSKDNDGYNIFHLACWKNPNLEIIQYIYNQFKTDKVFLESKDNNGNTALSLLSQSKRNLLVL